MSLFRRNKDEIVFADLGDPVILGPWDLTKTPGLRDALIEVYSDLPQVQRAYLTNIESPRPRGSIGLFVASRTGEDATVLERTFATFTRLYGTTAGLQFIFLHAELERSVAKKCSAFYAAA